MIADRAGLFTALAADCIATSAYSTPTLSTPAQACAASRAVTTNSAVEASSATLRRSKWSTSAPPYRPSTTSGTSAQMPRMPTARVDPVRE